MIGLDVTLLARATPAVQERMRSLGALGSQLLLPALAQYRDSDDTTGEPPVHDVCAIVSIADPAVFSYTPALVQVETHGTFTSGMTVTDFSHAGRPGQTRRSRPGSTPTASGRRARRLRDAPGRAGASTAC